ncbi:hypothetical protein [Propionivibrio limicola]|uniref:hypothetical protein n=1 Tax=Propionivibrio limicola TaxID=167645 RepID=UPI0012923D66|nr:hypothetical protein [Propionivibrio limicola]
MKKIFIALAWVGALSTPALATDVGMSLSIGQPGFYGQIDIGGYPRPALIYSQPVVIEHVPVRRPPIYLHVPPGHAKHWSKHCYEYGACGERVYFVKKDWYAREYVPRYQRAQGEYRHHDRDRHRHHEDYRHGGRDYDRDHDRDRGRGHGRDR